MTKRSLPLSQVDRLLEPGPVVLVSTASRGRANVMAMSWHTVFSLPGRRNSAATPTMKPSRMIHRINTACSWRTGGAAGRAG